VCCALFLVLNGTRMRASALDAVAQMVALACGALDEPGGCNGLGRAAMPRPGIAANSGPS